MGSLSLHDLMNQSPLAYPVGGLDTLTTTYRKEGGGLGLAGRREMLHSQSPELGERG
jgi:hypothetical protein